MKHYNVVSIYIKLYVPFVRYVYQHNVGNAEQDDKKVAKCQREYVPQIFDGPIRVTGGKKGRNEYENEWRTNLSSRQDGKFLPELLLLPLKIADIR